MYGGRYYYQHHIHWQYRSVKLFDFASLRSYHSVTGGGAHLGVSGVNTPTIFEVINCHFVDNVEVEGKSLHADSVEFDAMIFTCERQVLVAHST